MSSDNMEVATAKLDHRECNKANHVYHERPHGEKGCPFCELRDEFYESLVGTNTEIKNVAGTLRGEQAAVARELRQDIKLIKDKVDRFINKHDSFTELSFTDPLQAMAWATAPDHRMIEVICDEDKNADGGLVYIARRI